MDIEQRLEALTHSVELLAGMQVETEKHLTRIAEMQIETERRMQEFSNGMMQVARILANHENRIDRLEGKNPQ
jgi:hypothetical protein